MQELSGETVARYDRLVHGLHLDHIRHRAGQRPPPAAPADGYSRLFCMMFSRRRENMGYRGKAPVLVSPRYMILSGIWDFTKRGRGIALDLSGSCPACSTGKQEGVPGGHSLSLSAGATLPRLGVYARSLPAPPAVADGRSPAPAGALAP